MAKSKLDELKAILSRALSLEYTLIIHYPRFASMIADEDTKRLVNELGTASVRHADAVASALIKLGGKPKWSFEAFPAETNLPKIFQTQLGKEKTALDLHRRSAYLVSDSALRQRFEDIAREEESHITMVESILARLTSK